MTRRSYLKSGLISLLCAVLLLGAVGLFAEGKQETPPAAPAAAPAPAGPKPTEPGTFPVTTEPVTLTLFCQQHPGVRDIAGSKFTQWFEKKTGVRIAFILAPQVDMMNKFTLIMSSGEKLPDMMSLNQCPIPEGTEALYGKKGMVIPLNDLLAKYGYYTNKMFEEVPVVKKYLTQADGKIYSFPYQNQQFPAYTPWWIISKPWFAKLGYAMDKLPDTPEKFYQALVKIRDTDLNGNGQKDEIPLIGWPYSLQRALMALFVTWSDNSDILHVENSKVVVTYTTDDYRQCLSYSAKLYAEGLLYKGNFSISDNSLIQKIILADPQVVGVFAGAAPHGYFPVTDPRINDWSQWLPPIVGPNGKKNTFWNISAGITQGNLIITKDCKYPEIAFRWGDSFLEETIGLSKRLGIEGEGWEKPAADAVALPTVGSATPKDWPPFKPLYKAIAQPAGTLGIAWGPIGPVFIPFRVSKGEVRDPAPAGKYDGATFYYTAMNGNGVTPGMVYDAPKEALPNFVNVDPNLVVELSQIRGDLNKYRDESFVKFVTGQLSVEKDWDAYVKQCEKLGLPKLVAAIQATYDKAWK